MRTTKEPEFVWEMERSLLMQFNTKIGQESRLKIILDSIEDLNRRLKKLKGGEDDGKEK